MSIINTKTSEKKAQNFPVVGIGFSDGGLEAVKKMLSAISQDSGMAFILTKQSACDNKTELAGILSDSTSIPVHEIIHQIDLKPNQIYIVPDNNMVVAEQGLLQLKLTNRSEIKTNNVDMMFASLAETYGPMAVGIVLSGTANDGITGLKNIKGAGGITIAQDPSTASSRKMPSQAIAAQVVDYVLSPEKIPSVLLNLQKSYRLNYCYTDETEVTENYQKVLEQLSNYVLEKTAVSFQQLNQLLVRKCIAKRMVEVQKDSIEGYYNFLRNDKSEQELLVNAVLSPLTHYSSRNAFFEQLISTGFPLLIKNSKDDILKIWAAGCGEGQGTFLLAILLHEYLTKTNTHLKIEVFGTDLSKKCIAKARRGTYSSHDLECIPLDILERYFTKTDGKYRIAETIRNSCYFSVHNLSTDPSFTNLDLIVCRNVFHSVESRLHNDLLNLFHQSLKEKGILAVDSSTPVSPDENLFERPEESENIYIRKLSDNSVSGISLHDAPEQNIFMEELVDRQHQLNWMQYYCDSIISTIREPLLVIDSDFNIHTANPAYYIQFQTTEIQTEGFSFFEIGNGQWSIPEFKDKLGMLVHNNEILSDLKLTISDVHNHKKTLIVNARSISDESGDKLILIVFDNITDLVEANSLLQTKNTELQNYNNQLETFTMAASEDLQEPLRKMNMFCKRVFENETNLTETGKHNLERVLFSINHMSQLIEDLIDYSKINFIEKESKTTDLNLVLKRTLSDLKENINEKNAVISAETLPHLNVVPNQFQQLFTKLISNSITYSKEDTKPEIKIDIQPTPPEEILELGGDTDRNYIKICVSDNGIGLEKNYQERIFEPFYKIHNQGKCSGSGLGLTLAHKIVSNHNGFIKADGKLNAGTTMSIYIPQ
jgi:chemotaxis methyl-accepting protein methylase/signal transduction histidine kinase